MAAATILQKIWNYFNQPGVEVVSLTASDGETYTSKKFKTLLGAVVCSNQNQDQHINVTISGQTATINWASASDWNCTLMLFGRK